MCAKRHPDVLAGRQAGVEEKGVHAWRLHQLLSWQEERQTRASVFDEGFLRLDEGSH